jgi:hypothetical protein
MTLGLGAACKLSYCSECLGKNASAEPSTKDGIEAIRPPNRHLLAELTTEYSLPASHPRPRIHINCFLRT